MKRTAARADSAPREKTKRVNSRMPDEKRIGVGVGVMILNQGKILLGKRHADPSKAGSLLHGAGTWTMPGGKMRFGESFEEAGIRETLEETGVLLKDLKVLCVSNDRVEDAHFVTIGLFCEKFEGELEVREPEKITEWKWFALDHLPSPLYFPSRKVLEKYNAQKFYLEE